MYIASFSIPKQIESELWGFLKAQMMLFIAVTQLFSYNFRTLTVDFLLLLALLTLLLSE